MCRCPQSTSAASDVLPALREADDVYVSNFTPTKYQGVVEPHDLVMDLGATAGGPDTFLFLRGWIYPTDASINVALSQQSAIKLASPSLEVRDANGQWRTVYPNIGFPSGKDKTMIVDLAGKFPTGDHHVRIRTNMQIYWDQAFVARDSRERSGESHDARARLGRSPFARLLAHVSQRAVATVRTGSPTITWRRNRLAADRQARSRASETCCRCWRTRRHVRRHGSGRRDDNRVRRVLREVAARWLAARFSPLHRRVDQGLRP